MTMGFAGAVYPLLHLCPAMRANEAQTCWTSVNVARREECRGAGCGRVDKHILVFAEAWPT